METLAPRFVLLGSLTLCPMLVGCVGEGDDPPGEAGDSMTETVDTGLDPDGDADDDGLTNEEEDALGTDPRKVDSDDDSYWDSWELAEQTDPLDPDSRIYTGYWPYNPNKDALEQGEWANASRVWGSQFPRMQLLDQYGDAVDSYDFSEFSASEGADESFIIVDVSTQWCGPCHFFADWLADKNDHYDNSYPTLRDKIATRKVLWLTFVGENLDQGPATLEDAQLWHDMHPNEHVPVLVEEVPRVRAIYAPGGVPLFFVLRPDMSLEYWSSDNYSVLGLVEEYL